jgi:hypothetical protein
VVHVRRHRRIPLIRAGALFFLLVALGASARLLTLPQPHAPGTDWTLAEAYPRAAVVDVPGFVDGDWAYQPMLFLDARTSIGIATPGSRGQTRLVVLRPDGTTRTVRTLGVNDAPQFGGFAAGEGRIVWLEQTAGADGQGDAQIWVANADGGDARMLTHDVGEFAFYNSQYDMIIRGGRAYWTAAVPGDALKTEIRSVSLAGGQVSVHVLEGDWQAAGGDWLVTAMTGGGGATELIDRRTGRRERIPNRQSELISCSAALCRVLVLGGDGGTTRIDVMRPDGTDRHKAIAGAVTAALVDVGLLDRWEVYSRSGRGTSALSSQQVLLYDAKEKRIINLADGAGQIMGRDGFVWWGAGTGDYVTYQVLDLHTLH